MKTKKLLFLLALLPAVLFATMGCSTDDGEVQGYCCVGKVLYNDGTYVKAQVVEKPDDVPADYWVEVTLYFPSNEFPSDKYGVGDVFSFRFSHDYIIRSLPEGQYSTMERRDILYHFRTCN